MYQHSLFDLEDIFDKPLRRYELFFSILNFSLLEKGISVGRKPISRAAILRALIFKNLRSITSLSDLSAELYELPALASILGFPPGDKPVPVERFSSYLNSERVFSRLLSILMQKLSVIGITDTANLCTISHITFLAVAYFSSFVKEPNKIRFVKSFLPNF